MRGCSDCTRMAAQLADARDELAAWRAFDQQNGSAAAATDRLGRWQTALKCTLGQASALIRLADARGGIVTREMLTDAARASPSAWIDHEEVDEHYAYVIVCHLRRVLRTQLPAVTIENRRGLGYVLTKPQTLLVFVGEAS